MASEDLKKRFGKRLKEIREILRFSRKELAKESNISVNTLRRIENGISEPKPITIEKIQKAICLDYADFFDFDNNNENEIINKYIYYSIININHDGLKKYFSVLKLVLKFANDYNQEQPNSNKNT